MVFIRIDPLLYGGKDDKNGYKPGYLPLQLTLLSRFEAKSLMSTFLGVKSILVWAALLFLFASFSLDPSSQNTPENKQAFYNDY